MNKILLYLGVFTGVATMFLSACNSNWNQSDDNNTEYDETDNNQWVFVSVETILNRDSTDYFYYGQMDGSILKNIEKKDKGFFYLRNIRFIDDSNKLEIYEDSILNGSRIFRIKDIVKVELYKKDPILTYKYNELTENAKKVYHKLIKTSFSHSAGK